MSKKKSRAIKIAATACSLTLAAGALTAAQEAKAEEQLEFNALGCGDAVREDLVSGDAEIAENTEAAGWFDNNNNGKPKNGKNGKNGKGNGKEGSCGEDSPSEGSCGEGSCGEDSPSEGSCGEGSPSEGSCGEKPKPKGNGY